MNVSSATSKRPQGFDKEENEALHKDASTSAILNKARHDAGYKDPDLAVRGDDATLHSTMTHHKEHVGVVGAVAEFTHCAEVGVAATEVEAGAAGALLEAAGPVAGLVAGGYHMYETWKRMDETVQAATRDQMHGALVGTLRLPGGYKEERMRELGVRGGFHDAAFKIDEQLAFKDHGERAVLQLHADKGMNAARDMLESGTSKEAFLASHPKIAAQYKADAAFKEGFDALVWAKGHGDAYGAAIKGLESRDARYDQAGIGCRVQA